MTPNHVILLLGPTAKDKVTGFAGVIVSVSFDLYGCVQALIHPGLKDDGTPADQIWLDMNRLAIDPSAGPVMESPHSMAQQDKTPLDKGPADKPVLGRQP